MGYSLLKKIAHDERKSRHVTLGVPLEHAYRRVCQNARVFQRAKESVTRLFEGRGGRDLRESDDPSWLLVILRACTNERERGERQQKVSYDRAADRCSVSVDLPRQRDTTLEASLRLCQARRFILGRPHFIF
jgi:hypothetical protein